ncbi:hypothetical protein PVK06_041068 [Gossypium arboreum]|uniref:Uncharacterized protein n=1 Tax=Gossypium arboreum TaxID=29729 RepID=A0ABR0N9E4_GOSAR|nr:hypothetical protein PVK06_041068 [Gossypium arboreum]
MRAEVRHRDRGQSVQWHSRQGNWESNQASNQAGIMGLDNNGSKSRLSNRCINFPKDPLFITGSGVTHLGLSGGLALLWNSTVHVTISSFSQNHIDAHVQLDEGLQWRLTVNEFIAQMLIEQQNDKKRRVLRMLWGIWFSRNMMLVLRPVVEGGDVCWRKQIIGILKCNVDGDTFVDSGQMGWAAVVHNDAGGFVRCISGSMKSSRNPFMTEILALREDVS